MIKKLFITVLLIIFSVNTAYSSNANFYLYLKTLKQTVNKVWLAQKPSKIYATEINFKVYSDGKINDISVSKSSGNNEFDSSAINAITDVYQFEPLPGGYNSEYIDVTLTMTGSGRYDLQKVFIKKVIFLSPVNGDSNFLDRMIKPVFNLNIQSAKV